MAAQQGSYEPLFSEIAQRAMFKVFGEPSDPTSEANRMTITLKDNQGECKPYQFYTAKNFETPAATKFPRSQWNNLFFLLVHHMPDMGKPSMQISVREEITDYLINEAQYHPPLVGDQPITDHTKANALCIRRAVELMDSVQNTIHTGALAVISPTIEKIVSDALVDVLGSPNKEGSRAYLLSHTSYEKGKDTTEWDFLRDHVTREAILMASTLSSKILTDEIAKDLSIVQQGMTPADKRKDTSLRARIAQLHNDTADETSKHAVTLIGHTLDLFRTDAHQDKRIVSLASKELAQKIVTKIQERILQEYMHPNSAPGGQDSGKSSRRWNR